MKKLVFVLLLLLAAESYGVYGAAQTKRITNTCSIEVGPLCYAWEENAVGKLLGAKKSAEVERALAKARKAWEDDFVSKATKAKESGGFEKALEKAGDLAKEGLEKAKDVANFQ